MVNLYFNLIDATNQPMQAGSIATITPINYPTVSGSFIFVGDPIQGEIANGTITFNNVNPNYYWFSAKNYEFETTFSLLIPSGSTGSINGADLAYPPVQGQFPNWIPATASIAYTASHAFDAISASEADKLDGQHGSYYRNASNLNAGTISSSRLSGFYNISSSLANTSSFLEFDGNRSITRTGYAGINVGGADVNSFLNNFFFPFSPATIALTNAGTYYYETGSNQNFAITFTVTPNSETSFGTCSIYKNYVSIESFSVPPYSNTKLDAFVSASSVYQAKCQTSNSVIESDLINATYIYPYLYGMSATAGLNGSNLYSLLNKSITPIADKTISCIGTSTFIYFVYPAEYADLNQILDPNLFDVTDGLEYSASVSVSSVDLANNWTHNYKVYRTKLLADPNGNFQFKY